MMFFVDLLMLFASPIPYFELYITSYVDDPEDENDGIQCIPQFLSDYLLGMMFLRIIFVARCFINYSLSSNTYFRKICKQYGFKPGTRYTLKSWLVINPMKAITCIFLLTIFITGYVLRIFEMLPLQLEADIGKQYSPYHSMFDAIYLVTITTTTVGYGDISPKTPTGRIICMFTGIWGAIIISLIVTTVSNVFTLTENQNKAVRHIQLTK